MAGKKFLRQDWSIKGNSGIPDSFLVLMYIFKGKHFTLGVFVPKVGHHVALNNVHSGCHVVVHECENNYPCMAAGDSPSLIAQLP